MASYKNIQVVVSPKQAFVQSELNEQIAKKIGTKVSRINTIQIIKKSTDARKRNEIKINLTLNVYTDNTQPDKIEYPFHYQNVQDKKPVLIIGAGPAGLFAALRLIELGMKPIIIERGKMVSDRKKDIALLNRREGLNPESNYCFGEGGAGTFSDGKLFTRSKKKGDCSRILLNFHIHGAQDTILYEAHPHIGTDKLPTVIKNMRETILKYGGEIHFETKLSELIIQNDTIKGIKTVDGKQWNADDVILATGHSARDIYEMLNQQGVDLECKGFAMGVRVEHQQLLIDQIQYHSKEGRGNYLPAAAYNLVTQVEGRGVYSFCMCPGGFIVPASTNIGEGVVNGMSSSLRNSKFANSGIVVEIRPEDLTDYQQYGVMAGLKFQEEYERLSYENGEGDKAIAPAQRLRDFVRGVASTDLPSTSYLPGIKNSPIHEWMPTFLRARMQEGFKAFDQIMHGFLTNDAIIIGVESRTSSPLRIPRNEETLEHIRIKGLYPCGEGAGYAGGITSSAVDGERCAEMIALKY
ncbi:MAG: FAD-dependent oxidoreductase [Paludibacteraceae bacterium]|nr:FAD-dependent oxidoreductase [Paludibacteraceae bacterium]